MSVFSSWVKLTYWWNTFLFLFAYFTTRSPSVICCTSSPLPSFILHSHLILQYSNMFFRRCSFYSRFYKGRIQMCIEQFVLSLFEIKRSNLVLPLRPGIILPWHLYISLNFAEWSDIYLPLNWTSVYLSKCCQL